MNSCCSSGTFSAESIVEVRWDFNEKASYTSSVIRAESTVEVRWDFNGKSSCTSRFRPHTLVA
jgi:hypothetical protein